jgi:hypothetical protein
MCLDAISQAAKQTNSNPHPRLRNSSAWEHLPMPGTFPRVASKHALQYVYHDQNREVLLPSSVEEAIRGEGELSRSTPESNSPSVRPGLP